MLPTHYRFESYLDPKGVYLRCVQYAAVAETPKGYWITPSSYGGPGWSTVFIKEHRRFVLKGPGRRFAYPNVADALEAFKHRQLARQRHARNSLEMAEVALAALPGLLANPEGLQHQDTFMGGGSVAARFNWDDY